EAPRGFRLPQGTSMGRVRLQVGNLERSLPFYQDVLGFGSVGQDGTREVLAAQGDNSPLVELHEHPGARPAARRGSLGLYHFAILLPTRASLGRFVRHLGELGVRAGEGDHLVSESFYLQDPDNLGIEVYADRPRSTWRRVGRELMMATDPVDVAGLLDAAGQTRWTGMPSGTTIGHVHLHVGDIPQAADFYSEAVGFDRTVWHYPGALFFAAGGYHHHLGTNTWAGSGAQPPAPGDARLLEWNIELPHASSVSAARESLHLSGFTTEWRDASGSGPELVTRDPWGTQLRISTTSESPNTPAAT
ncbi:MAG TPA: VOC family protein, partial [Gemmatimonadales bacterium]